MKPIAITEKVPETRHPGWWGWFALQLLAGIAVVILAVSLLVWVVAHS